MPSTGSLLRKLARIDSALATCPGSKRARPDPSRARKDPFAYAHDILRANPSPLQVRMAELALTPPYRLLLRSGNNVGKSWFLAWMNNWFFDSFEGIGIVTAPTQLSIKDILFSEIRQMRGGLNMAPANPYIYASPRHWTRGYTARDGTAFKGRHGPNMFLSYDEAVGLRKEFFDVGDTMFTGEKGHMWICAYNPTNTASQIYQEEQSGRWHRVVLSQLDHPNIAAELAGKPPPYPGAVRLQQVLDNLKDPAATYLPPGSPHEDGEITVAGRRYKPHNKAMIQVLGQWPASSGATVWGEEILTKMENTRHDLNPHWRVHIGCDVARYGWCNTTIFVKQGLCVLHAEEHNGWGTHQTAQRLRDLAFKFHGPYKPEEVPILIDGCGIGGGVLDFNEGIGIFTNAKGFNFISVQVTDESIDSRFWKLRTELWFNTRAHAANGLVDISRLEPEIKRKLRLELLSQEYRIDAMGRYYLVSKEEVKEKLGHSPDLVDGLNLACWGW